MIEELQVYFANVFLFLVEDGELVGSVRHFGNFEEGSAYLFVAILIFNAQLCLELLFLRVDKHGETLVPFKVFFFNEKGGGIELLFSHFQFNEGSYFDWVEGDRIDNSCIQGSFGGVTVIFHLGGFVFILENGHDSFASFLAHIGDAALNLPIDVFLLPQIHQ